MGLFGPKEPYMEQSTLIIPKGIDVIKDSQFRNRGDIRKVVFKGNVKTIERFAFNGCRNLLEIELPDKLEVIKENAFSNTSIHKIDIPERVKKIGNRAFQANVYLSEVTFKCKDVEMGEAIFCSNRALSKIKLPNGLQLIPKYFCDDCSSLDTVVIPNSVKHIGDWAFAHCERLSSVLLNNGLLEIGSCCFTDCISLKTIEIPNTIKRLKSFTFRRCKNLFDVKLLNGLTSIEDGCFEECTSLEDIDIPKSITYLGKDVFKHCNRLKTIYAFECNMNTVKSQFPSTYGMRFLNPSSKVGTAPKPVSALDSMMDFATKDK